MANPIQATTPAAMPQDAASGASGQNQQTKKRSFESVLKSLDAAPAQADQQATQAEPPRTSSGARLEQLRLDLMERTSRIQADKKTLDQMLPDLTDGRTRRGLLQEAMRGIKSPVLTGNDFKSILSEIEDRWLNVERIMTSDKGLTTGELLGLQARLYQVSQHVEVVSKVVDQVTGGIKTILNTNV